MSDLDCNDYKAAVHGLAGEIAAWKRRCSDAEVSLNGYEVLLAQKVNRIVELEAALRMIVGTSRSRASVVSIATRAIGKRAERADSEVATINESLRVGVRQAARIRELEALVAQLRAKR